MRLVLAVTNRCNMACAYCRRIAEPAADMPRDIAFKAVQFVCRDHPRDLQLGFYGGEPLLRFPLIREVVDYAKTLHPPSRTVRLMTTNGTLLTPERCGWLRKERFDLTVSLDGMEPTHDALRRFSGGGPSYDRCMEGLRNAVAHKLSPQVLIVADPRNVAGLAEGAADLYRNARVRRIAVVCNHDAAWPDEALAVLQTQCEKVGDLFIDSYRGFSPLSVNFIRNKLQTHIRGGYSECSRCRFGAHELFVDPSGRFFPCERFLGEEGFCLGNLQQGMDTPRIEELNQELDQARPECNRCPISARCVHWCGCRNYARTGSLARFDPFICAFEQMAVRIADRAGQTLFAERNLPFLAEFYGRPWLAQFRRKALAAFRLEKAPPSAHADRDYWR